MPLPLDENLPNRLRRRLREPLPNRAIKGQYSHELSYGRHFGPAWDYARKAAVLMLLRWDGSEWLLPMTKRQEGGIHSGQICCAGGGLEGTETATEAALRECKEETGWAPPADDVIGELSPTFVYASNNSVDCIVAATFETPEWNPDPREVAELIEVPLRHLCNDDEVYHSPLNRHGISIQAPCFRWQRYDLWGAASMMLAELKEILTAETETDKP